MCNAQKHADHYQTDSSSLRHHYYQINTKAHQLKPTENANIHSVLCLYTICGENFTSDFILYIHVYTYSTMPVALFLYARSHVNAIKIINWTKLWKTTFSEMLFNSEMKFETRNVACSQPISCWLERDRHTERKSDVLDYNWQQNCWLAKFNGKKRRSPNH